MLIFMLWHLLHWAEERRHQKGHGEKLWVVVGTPGLGYPLLLCLGKGLEVILYYVQTAGPLWSGVLFSRQRSRTCLAAGKGPGTPHVPEEAGAQLEQPGLRTSRGVRTPAEVPDPSWGPGPPV